MKWVPEDTPAQKSLTKRCVAERIEFGYACLGKTTKEVVLPNVNLTRKCISALSTK